MLTVVRYIVQRKGYMYSAHSKGLMLPSLSSQEGGDSPP